MKKNNGCFGSYLTLFVVLLMVLGEIQCIVKAIKSDWDPIDKTENHFRHFDIIDHNR